MSNMLCKCPELGIHQAVTSGHVECLKAIFNEGAIPKINEEDSNGKTPLLAAILEASVSQNVGVVEALVDLGADVNQRGFTFTKCISQSPSICQGVTPLGLAVEADNLDIIKALNRQGNLDVELTVGGGRWNKEEKGTEHASYTPLQLASLKGFPNVFNCLLEMGAQLDLEHMDAKLVTDYFDQYCLLQSTGSYTDLHLNCKVLTSPKTGKESRSNTGRSGGIPGTRNGGQPMTAYRNTGYQQEDPTADFQGENLNEAQGGNQDQENLRINRKFFSNLVKIPSNRLICQHPLITAFIDLHYSAFSKISHECQDCITHFALMLILLEFVSATSVEGDFLFVGPEKDCGAEYSFISIFAIIVCVVLGLARIFSVMVKFLSNLENTIGLGNYRFTRSHIWRRDISVKSKFWSSKTEMFHILVNIIGFVVIVVTVRSNCHLHWVEKWTGWTSREGPNASEAFKAKLRLTWLQGIACVYIPILVMKEIVQIISSYKTDIKGQIYINRFSNLIDWVAIVWTVIVAITVSTWMDEYPFWEFKRFFKPFTLLIAIGMWIVFCKTLMECLLIPKTGHYVSMYEHVFWTYANILVQFAPYLVGWAACFMAMTRTTKETGNGAEAVFGNNFFEGLTRTIEMFIGSINYDKLAFGEYVEGWSRTADLANETIKANNTWPLWTNETGTYVEPYQDFNKYAKYIGYIALLWFIFGAVFVMMNLLNAIAIGDIEELRANSIAGTNLKRIIDLLDHDPCFTEYSYVFKRIDRPPVQNFGGSFWTPFWFSREGRFGQVDDGGISFKSVQTNQRKKSEGFPEKAKSESSPVFLKAETIKELKLKCEPEVEPTINERLNKIEETMNTILDYIRSQNEKSNAK